MCVWVWGVTVSLTRHPDTVEGLVYRRYTPVYLGAHTWDGSRLKSVYFFKKGNWPDTLLRAALCDSRFWILRCVSPRPAHTRLVAHAWHPALVIPLRVPSIRSFQVDSPRHLSPLDRLPEDQLVC